MKIKGKLGRIAVTGLAVAVLGIAAAIAPQAAWADDGQFSVRVPLQVPAVLDPAGDITIADSPIENTGTVPAKMTQVSVTGASGVGGTWTCSENGQTVATAKPDGAPVAVSGFELASGESKTLGWETDYGGTAAAPLVGTAMATLAYTFEPVEPTAYAVFSADDNSLEFFKRASVPAVGEKSPTGKTATNVYTGIETDVYNESPWHEHWYDPTIASVTIVDEIAPVSTAHWFEDCYKISSLELSKLSTINVTRMERMFSGCKSLTSLDLSHFDTSNVTNLEYMFAGCTSLTNLDISSFDTSNAIFLNGVFYNCWKLAALDVSGWNTSKANNMYGIFLGCKSLTSLDLSSFDTSNVTDMRDMFGAESYLDDELIKLQEITLGAKFSFNGSGATRLTNLPTPSATYIPGADGNWYNTKGQAFAPADVPNNVADTYYASLDLVPKTAFAVYSADDKSLEFFKRYTKPKVGEKSPTGKTVTKLYTGIETNVYTTWDVAPWYIDRGKIANASFIDKITPTQASSWFSECYELTSIDLSNLDTSNVTNMSLMFSGCKNLTSLDLSPLDTSNVTDMSSMFSGCKKLASLDLSPLDTSNVTDMSSMFSYLSKLTTLDLSNLNTSNVTDMSDMFSTLSLLTSIDLSNLDTSNVTNMSRMFYSCGFLTSLDLSSFDTSNVTAMVSMFYSCEKLQEVTLGSKFSFNGAKTSRLDSLPTPPAGYIPGADGNWYNTKGVPFAPAAVPNNVADTYYAAARLVPKTASAAAPIVESIEPPELDAALGSLLPAPSAESLAAESVEEIAETAICELAPPPAAPEPASQGCLEEPDGGLAAGSETASVSLSSD